MRVPGSIVVVLVTAAWVFLFSPTQAFGQSDRWAAFALTTGPATDAELARTMNAMALSEVVRVARALPKRPDPDLSRLVKALLLSPRGQRQDLVLRLLVEGMLALEEPNRSDALTANEETLRLLLERAGETESPMLPAAVWRAASRAPSRVRAALLPEARSAATALHRSFLTEAEHAGPEKVTDPQLNAQAAAFAAFVRTTSDDGLRVLADAVREKSGSIATVRKLREAVRTASRNQ
jgi:hypothetical protein